MHVEDGGVSENAPRALHDAAGVGVAQRHVRRVADLVRESVLHLAPQKARADVARPQPTELGPAARLSLLLLLPEGLYSLSRSL